MMHVNWSTMALITAKAPNRPYLRGLAQGLSLPTSKSLTPRSLPTFPALPVMHALTTLPSLSRCPSPQSPVIPPNRIPDADEQVFHLGSVLKSDGIAAQDSDALGHPFD